MAEQKKKRNNQRIMLAVFALIVISALIFWYATMNTAMPPENDPGMVKPVAADEVMQQNTKDMQIKGVVEKPIVTEKPIVINFSNLDSNTPISKLMNTRKQKLGIKKSLDLIVRSDESFTIGGTTVAMRDILKKAFIKQQDVFEEKISESGEVQPEVIKEYGIYIVQPGDNIWNIHFRIIKEYYESDGITVATTADEPLDDGRSSGVGKLLKFSERVVIIYNIPEKKIAEDIDLLKPLTKIIVYSMDEVFHLLQEIDYKNVDSIRFDGETIWIPAQQPSS